MTVSGVCGSGTVVGRDAAGNAIVLTNAHVAGTPKGRIVQLERWEQDGASERGQGAVIASGYGRGMSVDVALLKCNTEFAKDVVPIPLADRYPKTAGGVTTFGCPRCERPSMQVLKLNRSEGQILTWKPEAIGGRSGSSVIDHTEAGPRVNLCIDAEKNHDGIYLIPTIIEATDDQLRALVSATPFRDSLSSMGSIMFYA